MKINNGNDEVFFLLSNPAACGNDANGGRELEKCSHFVERVRTDLLHKGEKSPRCTLFHKWLGGKRCWECQKAVRAAEKQGV